MVWIYTRIIYKISWRVKLDENSIMREIKFRNVSRIPLCWHSRWTKQTNEVGIGRKTIGVNYRVFFFHCPSLFVYFRMIYFFLFFFCFVFLYIFLLFFFILFSRVCHFVSILHFIFSYIFFLFLPSLLFFPLV